jgi:hypothetical protein
VIATGTPAGVGAARGLYLRGGDARPAGQRGRRAAAGPGRRLGVTFTRIDGPVLGTIANEIEGDGTICGAASPKAMCRHDRHLGRRPDHRPVRLSRLREVTVDPAARLVHGGGGCRLGDVGTTRRTCSG